MIKNMIQFEHTVDGKIFQFLCDTNAPIGHTKDALNKFIQYVCQIEDNIANQQKEAEVKKEEPME